MTDDRKFSLDRPQIKKRRGQMPNFAGESNKPELSENAVKRRPRSSYVENPNMGKTIKSADRFKGIGSKIQIALFIGVLTVYVYYLAPIAIEFLELSK